MGGRFDSQMARIETPIAAASARESGALGQHAKGVGGESHNNEDSHESDVEAEDGAQAGGAAYRETSARW